MSEYYSSDRTPPRPENWQPEPEKKPRTLAQMWEMWRESQREAEAYFAMIGHGYSAEHEITMKYMAREAERQMWENENQ